jgi:hypothetical protein
MLFAISFDICNRVLKANSMDPDQTAWMLQRRLVWIHAGRKRITLVLL